MQQMVAEMLEEVAVIRAGMPAHRADLPVSIHQLAVQRCQISSPLEGKIVLKVVQAQPSKIQPGQGAVSKTIR